MPTRKRSPESQARIDAMNAEFNALYADPAYKKMTADAPVNPNSQSPWAAMDAQAKQPAPPAEEPTLGGLPAALNKLGIGFNSPEIQQQIDLQNQKNKVPVRR